jgi:hypothetical protein
MEEHRSDPLVPDPSSFGVEFSAVRLKMYDSKVIDEILDSSRK